MRRILYASFVLAVVLVLLVPRGGLADEPAQQIDWNKARQLYQRERAGEKLTPEEQAYLDLAKKTLAQRRQGGPASRPARPDQPAQRLTPRERTGLVPLTQMTGDARYKGQDGGLYGGGSNEPPKEHAAAARRQLAAIRPLDADGKPADDGRIVLVSMGMSNTTQEFSRFKQLADADPAKSPRVAVVDGAQGGQAAPEWNREPTRDRVWAEVDRRLRAAGVTARQVQVVFIKQAIKAPARLGEFPAHAVELKKELIGNLQLARQHFPNLKVAYLSSRIYAGYATGMLNPEPYAYESAFSDRWVIQDQIKGEPDLNWDPAKGEVKSPLVLWGPYLWADGLTPRKADGLIYQREDLAGDGTHPSAASGREKVGRQLLAFFKTDPLAKGWFVKAGGEGQ